MEGGQDNTTSSNEKSASLFQLKPNNRRPSLEDTGYGRLDIFPTPTLENIASPHFLQASSLTEMEKIDPELMILEGVDKFMDYFSLRSKEGIPADTVFFLDRNARPLSYLMRRLYTEYCPDSPVPEMRFINIGRESGFDWDSPTHSVPFQGDHSEISSTYQINERGRIVVVDEFSASGRGLKKAVEKVHQAFPESLEVSGLTAFRDLLLWNFNTSLLGIAEYNRGDYTDMSLEALNEELGTEYSSKDIGKLDERTRVRFDEIFKNIYGTIPTVKAIPIPKDYEATNQKQSFLDKIRGKKFNPEQVKKRSHDDVLRKELRQLADEVKEYHHFKSSANS